MKRKRTLLFSLVSLTILSILLGMSQYSNYNRLLEEILYHEKSMNNDYINELENFDGTLSSAIDGEIDIIELRAHVKTVILSQDHYMVSLYMNQQQEKIDIMNDEYRRRLDEVINLDYSKVSKDQLDGIQKEFRDIVEEYRKIEKDS